jgi:hypothetical protein
LRTHPRPSDRHPAFLNHPSVQALLSSDSTTGCPRQAIRNRVRAVVSDLLAWGWVGPPFDLEIAASLRGFRVEITDGIGEERDGWVVHGPTPKIVVNAGSPWVRKRFTVAHEIVHTLFPDFKPRAITQGWRYRADGQSPVEQLCQLGASEFLMPFPAFSELVTGQPETVALGIRIAQTFEVSLEAALRHLVAISPNRVFLLILRMAHKPTQEAACTQVDLFGSEEVLPPMRLRVFDSECSDRCDHVFIPRHKSVPEQSVAYLAWRRMNESGERTAMLQAAEDWASVAGIGHCEIDVCARTPGGDGSASNVFCILRPLES